MGAPTAPAASSCQPRSVRGSTRVDSRGCSPGRGHFRTHAQPRVPKQGRGRGRAGRSPGGPPASRSPRIPESPRLRRRALQALPTNWLPKEVCGFPFSSFSPSFPLSGQRQIRRGRGPRRRRGPLSPRGWPSGLSEPASGQASRRKEERKTTDPFSSLRPPREGRSACASLVRTGKASGGQSREEQGGTAAADYTSPGARRSPAPEPREQGGRAVGLHIYSFNIKENSHS